MSFPANFDNAKNEETSMFEKRKVKRKKIDYMRYIKFKNDFYKILFSIGILIFLADFGSVQLFKELFQRARPCHILEGIRVVDGCGGPFGFISSAFHNLWYVDSS